VLSLKKFPNGKRGWRREKERKERRLRDETLRRGENVFLMRDKRPFESSF
jgi:hypothetical protein